MPSDSKFMRDSNGDIAVRVVTQTEALPAYDPDWMFGRDENGNIAVRVVVSEGGGGGSVDYSKTVQKASTIPAADASNAGQVYLYTGATNANFTQNYIYKNVKTATYTGTVSFEPATLSGTTVACSGDNFANFLTESGVEPLTVVSGSMTFDSASELWNLVGKDSGGNTVLAFQEYQQDFVDAGFAFTGTPQDGDVVAFTCTVEEASASYAWERIDVQPVGDSTQVVEKGSGAITQELAGDTIYNCGTASALTITFPATVSPKYISQVNFTSDTTATALTAPAGMVWLGNDIVQGVFVPAASTRYAVLFFYDGTKIRGLVQGV